MTDFTAADLEALAVRRGLRLDRHVYEHVVAALDIGKHVVLTGPPGTGKTTLAYLTAELGRRSVRSTGYQPVTATAGWDTETTVGREELHDGYRHFRPGLMVQAIEAGQWLVVDELNRADVDRAFGPLFTVLAGQPVVLPYHRKGSELPLSLVPPGCDPPPATEAINVPRFWRLIATMNGVDRDQLHRLSFALMRRFAFVEVTTPSDEDLVALLDRPGGDLVLALLAVRRVRDLGPALYLDSAEYAARRRADGTSASRVRLEAFTSFLLPQLDGCGVGDLEEVVELVSATLDPPEAAELRRVAWGRTQPPATTWPTGRLGPLGVAAS